MVSSGLNQENHQGDDEERDRDRDRDRERDQDFNPDHHQDQKDPQINIKNYQNLNKLCQTYQQQQHYLNHHPKFSSNSNQDIANSLDNHHHHQHHHQHQHQNHHHHHHQNQNQNQNHLHSDPVLLTVIDENQPISQSQSHQNINQSFSSIQNPTSNLLSNSSYSHSNNHHSQFSSPHHYDIPTPFFHLNHPNSSCQTNLSEHSLKTVEDSGFLDHHERKWTGNFYVWVYDHPHSSQSLNQPLPIQSSSSTSLNLSNQLIGGISKHIIKHTSFKPSNSTMEPKIIKSSSNSIKDQNLKKKGLMNLSRAKDTSINSDSSPNLIKNLQSPKPTLDPQSLSERLDALVDRSGIDPLEISKVNQTKFQSNPSILSFSSNPDHQNHNQIKKSKKNLSVGDHPKVNKKKLVSSLTNRSIISQLALGPGSAMNSDGIGSGQWKLVRGTITEDGNLSLYTSDEILLYHIYLPAYRRTDIRMVHQSIFGRLHCGVISKRQNRNSNNLNPNPNFNSITNQPFTKSISPPCASSVSLNNPSLYQHPSNFEGINPNGFNSTLSIPTSIQDISSAQSNPILTSSHMTTLSTNNSNFNHSSQSAQSDPISSPLTDTHDLSIYVCMPNSVLLESWLVICKCFCRPDDFRHLYPRSSKRNTQHLSQKRSRKPSLMTGHLNDNIPHSISSTNHHLNQTLSKTESFNSINIESSTSIQPERVRIWRGVEIQLLEGKKLGELRPNSTSIHSSHHLKSLKETQNKILMDDRRNSTGGSLPIITSQINFGFNASKNSLSIGTHSNKNINQDKVASQPHKLDELSSTNNHPSNQISPTNSNFNQSNSFSNAVTPSLTHSSNQQQSSQSSQIPYNGQFNASNRKSLTSTPLASLSTLTIASMPASSSTATNRSNSNHKGLYLGFNDHSNLDHFYFVEFVWDKEIVGRSTIKRNPSPFWKEEFKFLDIGSFKSSMILNVYQIKKSSKPQIRLIGATKLSFKQMIKDQELLIWLPIYPIEDLSDSNEIDDKFEPQIITGELNLSIRVYEQVVLGEAEYSKMLNLLNNDEDIELPCNLASMVGHELERLADLLLKIYESSGRLLRKLAQMAALEIDGNVSKASILFRANTLLTKMLESYMRLIGGPFLESSIGSIIRQICVGRLELEIDPAKLKASISANQREKILNENSKELIKLSNEVWQSIYINRSKCPSRLRKVFGHIQKLVGASYQDHDMRLTSVSAFLFLRFFVPAILNPRLFNLVQFQPDSKSQRTLTLLAKTIQGLGNLTTFGAKEPWMSVMNEFINSQLDSFRDYISFVSKEPESNRPEWTSKQYDGYGLPYALRASLPPISRDGIPILPHLLDPVRDCALLANLIGNLTQKSLGLSSSYTDLQASSSSSIMPPKSAGLLPESNNLNPIHGRHRPNSDSTRIESKSAGLASSSTLEFLKVSSELRAKAERRYLKIVQSELKDPNRSRRATMIESRNERSGLATHSHLSSSNISPDPSVEPQISHKNNSKEPASETLSPVNTDNGSSIPPINRGNSVRSKRSHTIAADKTDDSLRATTTQSWNVQARPCLDDLNNLPNSNHHSENGLRNLEKKIYPTLQIKSTGLLRSSVGPLLSPRLGQGSETITNDRISFSQIDTDRVEENSKEEYLDLPSRQTTFPGLGKPIVMPNSSRKAAEELENFELRNEKIELDENAHALPRQSHDQIDYSQNPGLLTTRLERMRLDSGSSSPISWISEGDRSLLIEGILKTRQDAFTAQEDGIVSLEEEDEDQEEVDEDYYQDREKESLSIEGENEVSHESGEENLDMIRESDEGWLGKDGESKLVKMRRRGLIKINSRSISESAIIKANEMEASRSLNGHDLSINLAQTDHQSRSAGSNALPISSNSLLLNNSFNSQKSSIQPLKLPISSSSPSLLSQQNHNSNNKRGIILKMIRKNSTNK
ncbi:hypothetical protein O181_006713 [Austropuccinia psidii MF-1]|uniref:Ras-GAP domain-containing protein n=1 Tax=Austropuccinia psidii MF-1 TaxID=1389203 RepID=A0A9Q3BKQ8_9BASI|nr:hypothetical protein [Austropuccinia psidii MF-1]